MLWNYEYIPIRNVHQKISSGIAKLSVVEAAGIAYIQDYFFDNIAIVVTILQFKILVNLVLC